MVIVHILPAWVTLRWKANPVQLYIWTEYQTMGGATKMERAQRVASSDMLCRFDIHFARGNFRHPDRDEAHKADISVISLDEYQRSSCQRG